MAHIDSAERHILCAHGDGHIGSALQPLVEEMRFVTAWNAAAALQQAKDHVFDLYIVAERLPDMSGMDACRRIRDFDPHTPILLCAASGESAETSIAEAGAQGRIAYPVDPITAPRLIRHSLAMARSRSLEARAAEHAAAVDEIGRRLGNTVARLQRCLAASELLVHDAALMSRAYEAFSREGGTPGDFKRLWPEVFHAARTFALSRQA